MEGGQNYAPTNAASAQTDQQPVRLDDYIICTMKEQDLSVSLADWDAHWPFGSSTWPDPPFAIHCQSHTEALSTRPPSFQFQHGEPKWTENEFDLADHVGRFGEGVNFDSLNPEHVQAINNALMNVSRGISTEVSFDYRGWGKRGTTFRSYSYSQGTGAPVRVRKMRDEGELYPKDKTTRDGRVSLVLSLCGRTSLSDVMTGVLAVAGFSVISAHRSTYTGGLDARSQAAAGSEAEGSDLNANGPQAQAHTQSVMWYQKLELKVGKRPEGPMPINCKTLPTLQDETREDIDEFARELTLPSDDTRMLQMAAMAVGQVSHGHSATCQFSGEGVRVSRAPRNYEYPEGEEKWKVLLFSRLEE